MGGFIGLTPLNLGHVDAKWPSVWHPEHQTYGLASFGNDSSWILLVSEAIWFYI